MNDPVSSRSKRATHIYTYRRQIMYLKSNGKVEMTFNVDELDTAKLIYVLIRSDSEDMVWDGMIYPDDFNNRVSPHFNSLCNECFCPCGKDKPS
ncbi:hypothetical protein ACJMK2_017434 [Sinanodonta woodiana]|uniref:Uncharacterized protein n=1 Tax=Sinanodonta woodiana TaxID=1069815 RepID=A0ABD3UAC4_SINWO